METHQIETLIRRLGIGATYRGYHYLNYGVRICLKDDEYLLSISKLLYPEIAREFNTTSSSVERGIRTAIQVCWDRGNQDLLKSISLRPLSCRPTVSEFLDILVGYLRQNSYAGKNSL